MRSSFLQDPPSSSSNSDSVDAMRNDIEALRREAQRRLDALTSDLEEFQSNKQKTTKLISVSNNDNSKEVDTLNSLEKDLSQQVTAILPDNDSVVNNDNIQRVTTTTTTSEPRISNTSPATTTIIMDQPVNDVHLLENTRVSEWLDLQHVVPFEILHSSRADDCISVNNSGKSFSISDENQGRGCHRYGVLRGNVYGSLS